MFDSSTDHALAELTAAGRAESAAAARKLALAARVWRRRVEADARDGVPFTVRAEFVAVEVATALSVSTGAANALMYLGDVLDTRLPAVRTALERGDLDVVRVRTIADRTASICDLDVLAVVEALVLERVLVPGRCVTRGQVAAVVDRAVASVDPALVIAQRERAVADRQLTVRPDADGMCSVWGALPAADGVTLDQRLRTMAAEVCNEDPRTLDQRRADAVVALARGHATLACACGSPLCTGSATKEAHHVCAPVVQVVVDLAVLLGAADLPGVLASFGIVDPETVRAIAADARWRRLLSLDGVPTLMLGSGEQGLGEQRYRPSAALVRLVQARDGHCRFPGCTVPATSCDLDHVVPFDHEQPARGGRTTAENLACLCRWHHRMKTEGHWQVRMVEGAAQHWVGPDGQHLHSVATGLPPDPAAALLPSAGPLPPDPGPWEDVSTPDDPLSGGDYELLVESLVLMFDEELAARSRAGSWAGSTGR